MTEENDGFNPQITNNGDVGEQKIAAKIVEGDEVQGDKDESQGKTEIAGDMHGNIENTNTRVEGSVNEAVQHVEGIDG